MKTIAIFASGTGSNALNIIKYFESQEDVTFLILSNNKNAPILEKVAVLNIPTLVFNKQEFQNSKVLLFLQKHKTNLVVLAGFLWLIPFEILKVFPQKVVNIHPSLLPKFGGKGMFGKNVHKAVVAAKEGISGITIHYVNRKYDEGAIILQKSCKIEMSDTPEIVAQKVLKLEHRYFPITIEKILNDKY